MRTPHSPIKTAHVRVIARSQTIPRGVYPERNRRARDRLRNPKGVVIARSQTTKQSISINTEILDCFAFGSQ